ncbi:MAG: peptidylprolyl isomerase [Woeseiaceae bacterium]|nr:peptidylprolyl isomerase [Woeseiaceae bacterium]
MHRINYLIVFAACLAAPVAHSQEPLSDSGEMLDGIAAIVNEGVVLQSELREQTEAIRQRARAEDLRLPPTDVLREQVLERLVVERIQLQRAERFGIQVSDQMVNTTLARLAEQNGVPFERLPEELAATGVDYADYRRDVRKQLTIEQLRQIDVIRRINVAPREIQQCIADIENNVVGNSEYDLSHILISVPENATTEQIAAAEARANEVHTALDDGADFGEMAVRYSDSQTSLEGGNLGWRKGDQLPTIFSDIVGTMAEGEYSEPMRAVSGFHIVKINNVRGVNQKSEIEQMHIRHILVTPNEIIDDATARQQLEDAVERIEGGESFAEVAKLLSDDPGSAQEGGDMGWKGPGTYVPEFEEVAQNAEIGEVTDPFRTRFGWHILEVMGKRTYDNTEDLKRSNCEQRVRNSKLADETELWLRRIRDEAYVETLI